MEGKKVRVSCLDAAAAAAVGYRAKRITSRSASLRLIKSPAGGLFKKQTNIVFTGCFTQTCTCRQETTAFTTANYERLKKETTV